MIGLQVLGDRVLVALPPDPEDVVSPSGLILVRDPDRFYTPTRGIVVRVGEKSGTIDLHEALAAIRECTEPTPLSMAYAIHKQLCALKPAPFEVHVGDCVIFSAGAGDEVEHDGQTYVILHEADIYGIVAPKEEAA